MSFLSFKNNRLELWIQTVAIIYNTSSQIQPKEDVNEL